MSHADQPADVRVRFTDILDRMRLLGDDFTSHADDHEVIRALADAPEEALGPTGDVVPEEYCQQLDLPPGSTFRVTARQLSAILGLRTDRKAD